MSSLQPGTVLHNRYRIVNLLGQGGFGTLYRVWDMTLGRPCALKENLDTTPETQRQFLREAKIQANLSHPNLPRVTDFFLVGPGQYLVMDYIEGQDLQEMLEDCGKPLPESQVLPWIAQVCDALSYLHSQNPPIIHRDIKPANIKITPAGQAVLVDFGIAKVFDPQQKTTVGAQAVTPGFSPHEQYGKGATDGRTDIYALGATIYTVFTGQEPPESMQRVVRDPLIPPRQLNPNVSIRVSAAIMRAMNMDASQRFQQASELKQALLPPPLRPAAAPARQAAPLPPPRSLPSQQAPWGWIGAAAALSFIVIMLVIMILNGRSSPGAPAPATTAALLASPAATSSMRYTEEAILSSILTTTQEVNPTEPPQGTPLLYTVQPGDTCSAIALTYNISIRSIVAANNLPEDCGLLYAGQTLLLPASAPALPTPTALSPVATQVSPRDNMLMVYIPSGDFWMGARDDDTDAVSGEKPLHAVYVGAYWIDQTEVTNAMYARCVRAGACQPPAEYRSKTRPAYFDDARFANYPVINVSWQDGQAYCTWAGRRLPTEAEWEKAARGEDRRLFPWGDQPASNRLANFNNQVGDTTPVGNYPAGASPYAALDMAGNVAEWVQDWYNGDYYLLSPYRNPFGPNQGEYRVLRGGSWFSQARALRTAFRFWNVPELRFDSSGFRCAYSP